jgi:general secretion pathway protein E
MNPVSAVMDNLSCSPGKKNDYMRLAEFAEHIVKAHKNTEKALRISLDDGTFENKRLRDLWEQCELPAGDFADEVSRFYGLGRVMLPELMASSSVVQRFSRRFLQESAIFPYVSQDGRFRLVVADPNDFAAVRAAEIVLGAPVTIEIGSFEDIATALGEKLNQQEQPPFSSTELQTSPHTEADIESLRDLASGAPVVRAVDYLLEKAIEMRATDIHIEPLRTGLAVRMRVDGLLRPVAAPVGVLPQALISRIKILAGLNIAERRLPQDGAARLRVARADLDIRVATVPTQHGESAALRLLPKDRGLLDIAKLGLSRSADNQLNRIMKLPHGMIIVTGPTGSGKTTTLATILSILNDSSRKILTIEDPVEYEINGVNQSQVKPAIGFTFATALRAFVRQDPDVIMVGEVRDAETAHIAVHAALTGHLVLTTLHTETAAAAIPRLLDLGVEGYLLQSTLRAVLAQRLVRMLCERCKRQQALTATDLSEDPRYAVLGFAIGDTVHEPGGCERCSATGYRGRTGIFEILEMSDSVRELIGPRTDAKQIARAGISSGMTTMLEDAILKCRTGVTSVAEVLRVTTIG